MKLPEEKLKDNDALAEELKRSPSLEDDREEANIVLKAYKEMYGSVEANKLQRSIRSTVIVMRKEDLTKRGRNGRAYYLNAIDLGKRVISLAGKKVQFSDKLKLRGQRAAKSLGTGFLYRKGDRFFVVTAGHVLHPAFLKVPLKDIRFVCNFIVQDGRQQDSFATVDRKDVFKPAVMALEPGKDFELSSYGEDYAVVEIVTEDGKPPAKDYFLSSGDDEGDYGDLWAGELKDKNVYGVGHGLGLPLKVSPCGKIIDLEEFNGDSRLFECELDFFSGNSGSPLFETNTHKLVGMLVRGKKDVYFKENGNGNENGTLAPGVLSGENAGEVFQKLDFLKNINPTSPNTKLLPSSGEADSELQPHQIPLEGLVPYVRMVRHTENNYFLYINFNNENRIVLFPAHSFKEGDITVIECYLCDIKGQINFNDHYKKYLLKGPSQENLGTSARTVEVRVFDRVTGNYHISVLDFNNASPSNENQISEDYVTDEIYWASCQTKKSYMESKLKDNLIGVSLGYFKEGNDHPVFVKSEIHDFPRLELENTTLFFVEQNGSGIVSKKCPDGSCKQLVLSPNGDIRKSTSLGGRNPKPTMFIEIEDVA
ncbi:MAG: serine protease [Bacteroidota bacterium]